VLPCQSAKPAGEDKSNRSKSSVTGHPIPNVLFYFFASFEDMEIAAKEIIR
jgi:hypothetical protein